MPAEAEAAMLLAVRIAAATPVADDVLHFELVAADGAPLPLFTPGSHIDVHLDGGIVRQYSLTNGPHDRHSYTIAVKLEPQSRGGSLAMHHDRRPGDIIRIGAPRNAFPIAREAAHHVLLAAGIGVTPVLSMARHLHDEGASFELHFFYRSAAFAPFLDELRAAPYGRSVRHYEGLGATATQGALEPIIATRSEGAHLYFCGPPPFMDAVQRLSGAAWPAGTTHFEHFTPQLPVDAGAFSIRLAKSERTLTIGPNETIIDVLTRHGIAIDVSCEVGICGTCVTHVLEGVPDHRDQILTAAERARGDVMTICCSRAVSPSLVLDL